jgi:hypothetical protein
MHPHGFEHKLVANGDLKVDHTGVITHKKK